MIRYQFRKRTDSASRPEFEKRVFTGLTGAKTFAGRLAKEGITVDIAVDGVSEWEKRYITTAHPSEKHTQGYKFSKV